MLTLLQLELLNTALVGGDGGTLDTNAILLDSLSGLDSDSVLGLVTVLDTLYFMKSQLTPPVYCRGKEGQ